ncbi:MAG: ribosome assembly factor SBDS [Candidatus Micrarchaeota archaeon]|nr:ribosome assembly factor SBDS [Candidatus Micrarchaeota archaeon]
MVSLDNAVILRLEKNGERFEIFADPLKVVEYRKGAQLQLNDVLAAFQIFKDGRKGDTQSDEVLKRNFGTTAFEPIAKEILLKGELHLTTEQKKKQLEEKRAKVIQYIAQNYIDPRTNAPHPVKRIELAMEEAKVHIDAAKSAEAQVEDVLKKLRPILPLKFEVVRIAIKVPPAHAHRAYGAIKEFSPKKEEWLNDGSLVALVEIPPGMQAVLFDKLNKLTHGDVQTKILDK